MGSKRRNGSCTGAALADSPSMESRDDRARKVHGRMPSPDMANSCTATLGQFFSRGFHTCSVFEAWPTHMHPPLSIWLCGNPTTIDMLCKLTRWFYMEKCVKAIFDIKHRDLTFTYTVVENSPSYCGAHPRKFTGDTRANQHRSSLRQSLF